MKSSIFRKCSKSFSIIINAYISNNKCSLILKKMSEKYQLSFEKKLKFYY